MHLILKSITSYNEKILIALFTLAVCILPGRTAAQTSRNPILPGFHADPEILYSNKDNKYYIYSTTDGVPGWGGYYYHAFSAPTIDGPWTDCGVVLDAKSEQVPWADGNLWAPAAIERKEGDSYKYYLYFSANNPESRRKEISVAVADDPAGPFTALPQPMIKDDPSRRGQQIDVDVFQDPVSGKYYLYWGNSFMAGAELDDDLTSIKEETITLLTPRAAPCRTTHSARAHTYSTATASTTSCGRLTIPARPTIMWPTVPPTRPWVPSPWPTPAWCLFRILKKKYTARHTTQ